MTFNSLSFAVFFGVVFCLYQLPFAWAARKGMLLVASYGFYAAWNPPFIGLLFLSTVIDWVAARQIAVSSTSAIRRLWLLISLCTNLGLLGFFKYGNFALENVAPLMRAVGIEYAPAPFNVILPWGISFYTFQSMSYTIDIYRGEMKPWDSFLDFALFISFFPQLLAGPIMRGHDFLPQCVSPPTVSSRQVGWGLSLFILGVFLKTVVSDTLLAPVVDTVYADPIPSGMLSAWCAAFGFSGQLYCDFCGYSTCAIGLGMCLGFSLPDNFNSPMASIGIADFWQRWHITLSSWFRDYVFFPLGGSRHGAVRTCINLFVTVVLVGLWHGAAWTFVMFGVAHGILLILDFVIRSTPVARFNIWRPLPFQFGLAVLTFVIVTLTAVIFRSQSIAQAGVIFRSMFGLNDGTAPVNLDSADITIVIVTVEILFLFHFLTRKMTIEAAVSRVPWWGQSLALAGMLLAIFFSGTADRAFIYFAF
ncbi:MAG: MBOAT family protein [Planctomycetaceae bacterium]|nr:MBOAT family protein [Planctomycetaceae bacterium]